ncbi:right-handed parallel beta-helix repeat-containing protein [Verrucomicrobiaceae bacterium 227]
MSFLGPFALFLGLSLVAGGANFYVSNAGNDSGEGSEVAPFATIERAQAAVREARKQSPDEGVTVTIVWGRYVLERPLIFEAEDSGASGEAPVIYRGMGEVEMSGGRRISGWKPDPAVVGRWKTKVEGLPKFEQLWVNGERAVRARTPDWWHFKSLLYVGEDAVAGQPGRLKHTFEVAPADLDSLEGMTDDDLGEVQVMVYHKWDTTREFLKTISPQEGLFTTEGSEMKSWNPMNRGCLYFLENFLGALDSPGEWFLDGDGWLYYQPREGEDMAKAQVVAPVLENLLEVRGKPGAEVKHLRFENLSFRHSALRTPAGGVPPNQAAMSVEESMVTIRHAKQVAFEECRMELVGGTGVWFREGAKNCQIMDSRMFDLGASGVRIGEMRTLPDETRTSHITVDNCIIHSGGRIAPSAVGVWIGRSGDNVVRHCDVADFYYTAISVGWVWGYGDSPSKRNRIEHNHLHHLGYRILSDMGGIYTLGKSEGTSVNDNVIHDVYATRYGGWGLYPDEGSTGIRFENNLVYDVHDGGFHQHYGRDNLVKNNILTFSAEGQVALTRKEEHRSFTFENNLVYWDAGRLFGGGGWHAGARVDVRNNLYWRAGGQDFDFDGKSFAEWQASGKDAGSLIADPMFVDAGKRDFRLKEGSPAAKVGFKPFDFSKAGVRGEEWRKLAATTKFPKPYEVPAPPMNLVRDRFERGKDGKFFRMVEVHQEGRDDLVTIVEDGDSPGNHVLKVSRHPDLKQGFNPHFYWNPGATEGVAKLSFRVRLEPGANMSCEWRSKGHPYKTGPALRFGDGKVTSRGKELMGLSGSGWVKVEMTAEIGKKGATWSAVIGLADGSRREFSDLRCDPEWSVPEWLGFSSGGAGKAGYELDDLDFEVR